MRKDRVECIYKDVVFKISTTKQKLKQKEYLQKGKVPVVDQGQEVIGGYTNDSSKILECDLPVVVFGDHTKNVKLINFPFAPGADGTKVLQPKKGVLPKYLSYLTEILVFKIKDNGYARHYQHIEKENFPLVSLPEQRAIVNKIEELFSSLDKGVADLIKAKDQFKIYRQAVLKKAFEGELTKEWRTKQTHLPTTDESLKILKETEELPVIPKGWKWIKSNELFSFVTSGSRGWAKYYSNDGSIFIRITNLNFDTLKLDLSPDKIQYVRLVNNIEGIRTKIQEGDFLFSITGYLGMFAIAPDLKDAYVNQHVSLCRPKDGFNKKYVGYWIISKTGGIHFLNKNKKGAVKAGLNLIDLKTFPVPICSTQEQHQIVQEIETRLSVCDEVEQNIVESLDKAFALRQSILKRAFDGELLNDEEITACKVHKDYEPASVLLERMNKEKL